MKWPRSSLVHFLFLGAVLFAASEWWSPYSSARPLQDSFRIDLETDRIESLVDTFRQQTGRAPEASELDRLIESEIDEEILFQEAARRGLIENDSGVQTRLIQKMLFLEGTAEIGDAAELLRRARALELHAGDIVVRRILVQKMRLLASSLEEDERPSDEEIAIYYATHAEAFRSPDRRSLRHLFFSIDERGSRTASDARAARERLIEAGAAPAQTPQPGDPFPLGHRLENRSERDLERSLGPSFARLVFQLPIEEWSEPIESAYGQHLVWVDSVTPGSLPDLATVQDSIEHRLAREKGRQKLERTLDQWRPRYAVFIDGLPRKNES